MFNPFDVVMTPTPNALAISKPRSISLVGEGVTERQIVGIDAYARIIETLPHVLEMSQWHRPAPFAQRLAPRRDVRLRRPRNSGSSGSEWISTATDGACPASQCPELLRLGMYRQQLTFTQTELFHRSNDRVEMIARLEQEISEAVRLHTEAHTGDNRIDPWR